MKIRPALALPLVFSSLLVAAAVAPQDPGAVDLRLEQVGGSVRVLYGAGGNIGVSQGLDGLLVVDSQFAWLAEKIDRRLRELADDGPRFLVNTHFHGDHTGGNAHFGEGATIVAHENVRERLESGVGARGQRGTPAPAVALPLVTYSGGAGAEMSLHFNGEEVRLFHIPAAHTDGDSAVWFTGSKVLHLGDTFFAGRFPFIDTASGGSVQGLLAGLEGVLERVPEDTKVIPGHGDACGMAELREYVGMLRETTGRVREALAAGRGLEEIRELDLLADYAPQWGSGFIDADAYLGSLVASLAGSARGE